MVSTNPLERHQKMIELFGVGGGEKTADAFGIPFLGKIPFDPGVVACGDTGVSFQENHPDSAASKAFADIAEKMATPHSTC